MILLRLRTEVSLPRFIGARRRKHRSHADTTPIPRNSFNIFRKFSTLSTCKIDAVHGCHCAALIKNNHRLVRELYSRISIPTYWWVGFFVVVVVGLQFRNACVSIIKWTVAVRAASHESASDGESLMSDVLIKTSTGRENMQSLWILRMIVRRQESNSIFRIKSMTITFLFNVITIQFKNYHQTFLSSTKQSWA